MYAVTTLNAPYRTGSPARAVVRLVICAVCAVSCALYHVRVRCVQHLPPNQSLSVLSGDTVSCVPRKDRLVSILAT